MESLFSDKILAILVLKKADGMIRDGAQICLKFNSTVMRIYVYAYC